MSQAEETGMRARRARRRVERHRLRVALVFVAAVSALAGMTDAIGLMIAGNFVSFMSGNTTRAGVALAEGRFGAAVPMLLAVAVFVAGNALGVLVAGRGRRAFARVLALVALLVAAAALVFAWPLAGFLLAVLAMAVLNAAVEQVAGLPIGLTYVTGALSRFGKGLGRRLRGEARPGWEIQIVPWCGMAAGAVAGAGLAMHWGAGALWVPAGCAAALALAGLVLPRRTARGLSRAAGG